MAKKIVQEVRQPGHSSGLYVIYEDGTAQDFHGRFIRNPNRPVADDSVVDPVHITQWDDSDVALSVAGLNELKRTRRIRNLAIEGPAGSRDIMKRRNELARRLGANIDELGRTKVSGPDGRSTTKLERELLRLETELDASAADVRRLRQLSSQASDSISRVNRWSEEMGMVSARDISEGRGESLLLGGRDERFNDQPMRGVPWKPTGSDALDLVSVSGDGKRLIVYEAKGGSSALGTRSIPDPNDPTRKIRVQQGSRLYLEYQLKNDVRLQERLKDPKYAELAASLANGTAEIEYHVVHAKASGTVRTHRFDIGGPTGLTVPAESTPMHKKSPGKKSRLPRSALARAGMFVPPAVATGIGASLSGALGGTVASAAPVDGILSGALRANSSANIEFADGMNKLDASGEAAVGLQDSELLAGAGSPIERFASLLEPYSSIFEAAAVAIQIWAIGQLALNLLLSGNPLGALVTAIGLAVTGVILIVENWDLIKKALSDFYQLILIPAGKWISEKFADLIAPMFEMCANGIGAFLDGISKSLSGLIDSIEDMIKGFLRRVADFVDNFPFFGDGVADQIRRFTDPERRADGGLLLGPGVGRSELSLSSSELAGRHPVIGDNPPTAPRFADGGAVGVSSLRQAVELAAGGPVSWGGTYEPTRPGSQFGVESGTANASGGRGSRSRRSAGTRNSFAYPAVTEPWMSVGSSGGSTVATRLGRFAAGGFVGLDRTAAEGHSSGVSGSHVRPMFVTDNLLATGGYAGNAGGSVSGFADTNPSMLELISQDAGVVSNLVGQQSNPTSALEGSGRRRRRSTDRSLAIHISSPDVDGEFLKDQADSARGALTYAGRW
ncbi:hypothetical protein [Nocardia sp. NPDC058666]|uniref:hypothetical protein n=1 Tax=unclassified Nocardia TaxID=2637762 RepID=UPI0036661281